MGDVIGLLQQAGFETFIVSASRRLRRVDTGFVDAGLHELIGLRDPGDFTARTGWQLTR